MTSANQNDKNSFPISNNVACLVVYYIVRVILIKSYLDFEEVGFLLRWGGGIFLAPLPLISEVVSFWGLLNYWQIGWTLSALLIASTIFLVIRKNKIIEYLYLILFILFFCFCFYKSIPPSPAVVEQEFDQQVSEIGRFRAEAKIEKLRKRYEIAMKRAIIYQGLTTFFNEKPNEKPADDEKLSNAYDELIAEDKAKKEATQKDADYGAWLRSFSDELGDLNRSELKISIFIMNDEGVEGTAGFVYPDPNDKNSKIFLVASSTNTSRFSTCTIASYLINNLEKNTVVLENCPDLTVKTSDNSLIIDGNDCGNCGMGAEITGSYQFVTNYIFHNRS
ncbi:hypothetical protein [Desulfobacter curvatus]|uniref:hypothetical protein n=1 Tax=Desulfobacter curvatus TaxID=2290 RepID=UPI0003801AF4|nr:hypothetical protein [Desulfobacter curvatus]